MRYNIRTFVAVCALSSALASSGVLASGDFGGSCTGPDGGPFLVSGTKLEASCRKEDGSFRRTSIDLNRCIVNDGINLACQKDGGFGGSCGDCEIMEGTIMQCVCAPNPPDNISSIDLNRCVTNHNGHLGCDCC